MPTDFNFAKTEEKILKFWKDRGIFEKSMENRSGAKRFVFFDGPPFATGLPHYGHILASTIKDLVPRFFTMRGFHVERRWGWDCHGLPIENIIERKLDISGRKEIESYGIGKFNRAAKEQVLQYADEWEKTVDRIGRFIDFRNSYKTMDATYMESVWWAFAEVYKKNLVYEDLRISLYCPRCETPLSNFEIAMDNSYRDVEDDTVFVKFKLKSGQKIGDFVTDDSTFILAWTTTPWTLSGNVALAVGDGIAYGSSKKDGISYIAAVDAFEKLELAEPSFRFLGKDLSGLSYEPLLPVTYFNAENTPNFANAFKVVAADFVSTQEGTGIVHIAPAFGEDDFNLAKKLKLPSFLTVNDSGMFHEWVDNYGGHFIFDANHLVIKDLESSGLLFKKEKVTHSYPVCYRCETKLLYKQQPAWFVAVGKIKKKMLAANKKIDWHPAHLKEGRFGKGLETAPDWNVSRSRFFGSPLPIWRCDDCSKEYKVMGSLEDLEKNRFRAKNTFIVLRHGIRQQAMAEDGRMLNNSKLELDKYDLTPEGVAQIEAVAAALKAEGLPGQGGVDAIYASPFIRAQHTAEIVGKALGVEVHIDARLKELDHGFACESRSDMPCISEGTQKNFDTRYGEGESWREVKKRMFSILHDLDRKNEGKKILLVSHGDPIWLLESAIRNMPEKEAIARHDEIYTPVGHFKKLELKNYPYNESGEVDMHRPYVDEIYLKCDKCGGRMTRLTDVFDCWFESGSMPYGQAHFPFENKKKFEDNFPADFVSEYVAQTRGWFYTMHVLSTAIFGKPPFKHVVTTGNILAENGEKLSKSKRNFPDPQLLLDKYGADSLRYFLMTSPVMAADNVFFSEKGVEEVYKNFILILSNVLRFWQLYENKYSQSEEKLRTRLAKPNTNRLDKIDEWILSRLESTKANMTSMFEKYEIMDGCRAIQPLIDDLSLWYVRRNRERIRGGGRSGEKAFLVLGYALLEISKLVAPFTPFIADHIYKQVGNHKESVHLEDWPKTKKKLINPELEGQMARVRELVTQGLALRKSLSMKVRQPLAAVHIKESKRFEPGLEKLILEELNVKAVVYDPTQAEPVKLDTVLTRELIAEGYARETMRQIQDMRKEAKYRLDEKIYAAWSSDGGEVVDALNNFGKDIARDTLLEEFSRGRQSGTTFDVEKEFDLGSNARIWLGVRAKK